MKNIKWLIMALTLIMGLCLQGCKGKNIPKQTIQFDKIHERTISITQEKQFSGFPLGLSLDEKEVYIEDEIHPKGQFLIHFVDWENYEIKRDLLLKAGDFQSPTEYYHPVQIELINGRYYVLDQFEKIVVYDQQLRYLYSSMFHQVRFFMDMFAKGGEIHFVLATHEARRKLSSTVELYRIPEKKRPEKVKTLSDEFEMLSIFSFMRGRSNDFYYGYFWPALYGFEKDQTIFYGINVNRDIHLYHLDTGQDEILDLAFLKGKKYTDKDAYTLARMNGTGGDESYKRQTGGEFKYIAYTEDTFYYGLYDVGKGKIGVVGDYNPKSQTFRLDIIDVQKRLYIESLWFPLGYSFRYSINSANTGLAKTFIDVDKGLYIYNDIVGEEEEYITKIVRFK